MRPTWCSWTSSKPSHESVTRAGIATRLAALKGFAFAGEHDPTARRPGPVYFVPGDTLVGVVAARALGILGEDDLFSGVVPQPVVATTAITHPLVGPDALAPAGWSGAFGRRVRHAVLAGYTAAGLATRCHQGGKAPKAGLEAPRADRA